MSLIWAILLIAIVAPVVGVAVDWAMFVRVVNWMDLNWVEKGKSRYSDFLYPRVILVILSSMILCYAAIYSYEYVSLAATILFVVANSIAYIQVYRAKRQR